MAKKQKQPSLKVAALNLRKAIAAYNVTLEMVQLAEKNLHSAQEEKHKAQNTLNLARSQRRWLHLNTWR